MAKTAWAAPSKLRSHDQDAQVVAADSEDDQAVAAVGPAALAVNALVDSVVAAAVAQAASAADDQEVSAAVSAPAASEAASDQVAVASGAEMTASVVAPAVSEAAAAVDTARDHHKTAAHVVSKHFKHYHLKIFRLRFA